MKRKTIKYIDDKHFSYGDIVLCIDDITDFFIEKNNLATDTVKHFNLGSISGLYQILKHYNIKKPGNKRGELSTKGCIQKYGSRRAICLKEYQEKSKQTCLEKYGYEYSLQVPEIKEKSKNTLIDRYGVDHIFKSREVREHEKQTWLKKYGVDNPFKSDSIKEKIKNYYLINYGCSHSEYVFKKMKENNSYGKSRDEEYFYEKLLEIFKEEEIERQYRSNTYPFHCDFYILPLDTYIELNCNWTHGPHKFNKNSSDDLELLTLWEEKAKTSKYYEVAINVWTVLDVLKYEIAKKNNLKYFTLYTKDDINKFLEQLHVNNYQ